MRPASGQLQRAIDAYRSQLLAFDGRVLARTLQVYAPIRAALLGQIDELTAIVAANPELSGPELFRLARARELMAQVETEMATLAGQAGPLIAGAQAVAATAAATGAKALAIATAAESPGLAAAVASGWNALPVSALTDLVGRLSDGSPLRAWTEQFAGDVPAKLRSAMTEGLALGMHPAAIAQRLTAETDVAGTRLMAFARTTMLDSFRSSSLAQYKSNASILSGWQWLAELDGCCAACAALHGTIHSVDETFMGCHVNCRCSAVPVLKGMAPVIDPNEAETRFAAMTPEQQDAKLGKAGGQAYRDGTVTLKDFISVQKSEQWGDRYVQGSLKGALKSAGGRASAAIAPVTPPKPNLMDVGFDPHDKQSVLDFIKAQERTGSLDEADDDIKRALTKDKLSPFDALSQLHDQLGLPAPDPASKASGVSTKPKAVEAPKAAEPPELPDDFEEDDFSYDPDEFSNYRDQQWQDFAESATEDEVLAVQDYKGNYYEPINAGLRADGTVPAMYQPVADHLDAVLEHTVIEQDVIVSRGLGFDEFTDPEVVAKWQNVTPGSIIQDKGYMSTTTNESIRDDFSGEGSNGVTMEIKVPAGSNGLFIDPAFEGTYGTNLAEDEILLPRDSRLMVTKVTVDDEGRTHIEAALLPREN